MSQKQTSRSRSIPLFSVLMFLTGFAMILGYVKFGALLGRIPDSVRLIYFGVAALLLLWSMKQIAQTLIWGVPQKPHKRKSDFRVLLTRPGFAYLLLMIVMFIGAMLGRSNLLMLVFALMAGPFVLNGWITFSMLRFTDVRRTAPPQVMAGEPFSVEVAFKNSKRIFPAWLMVVTDRVANEYEYLEAHAMFTRVPGRAERRAYYRLKLMHRGIYHFGPFRVGTRFPLGLVERSQEYADNVDVLVYPRVGRLASSWRQQLFHATEFVEHRDVKRGMFDDEFHRIREYRPGDSPRSVHWRTSARQVDLMVREYQQTRDQSLTIFVELWQPKRPGDNDLERVELAASLAATMCVEHLRQCRDSKLCLIVSGTIVQTWSGISGVASVDSVLEVLAKAVASPIVDATNMWKQAVEIHALESSAVLISTRAASDQPEIDWEAIQGNAANAESTRQQRHSIQHIEAAPELLTSIFDLTF